MGRIGEREGSEDGRDAEMRKVIVSEFLSLDGVMQAPGLPDEDRSGGFEHGGWQVQLMDDEAGQAIMEGLNATGGLLLGRRTYEIFAGYWPNAPDDDPLAGTINDMPKYVVSTRLQEPLAWKNSHLIKENVPKEIRKLKEESGKDLRVIGSGELVQTLMEHGLVDQFDLSIYRIVLGSGKRLFRDGTPNTSLRLVNSQTSKSGVLLVSYEPEER
jgi:dihydrofolate reductase